MGQIGRSVATLRIFGDTLDPDKISELLEQLPTESFRKGEIKPSKVRDITRKSGGWLLQAKDQDPGNLDLQVEEILGQLTGDLNVWKHLSDEFHVDLLCGLFMKDTDEGLEISAKNLKALGDRCIKIGICIYAAIEDPAPEDLCPCGSRKKYAECCMPKRAAA